jgi:hypothetical protein
MKIVKYLLACISVLALVSCGGGGGDPGGSSTGVNTNNPVASSIRDVVLDFGLDQAGNKKTTLRNTGSDAVTIIVTALDGARNVVREVPVSVTVDNDAIFGGVELPGPEGFATDETGRFFGVIASPANKTNRTINVQVKVGSITRNTTIEVVGSTIQVTPAPSAPSAGQATVINMKLVDAGDIGIPSAQLNVSGTAGFSGVVRTDSLGNALLQGVAPSAPGTYSINVSGSGVTGTAQLTIGGVPDAIGPIGPGALNASPTNIGANITGSSNNRSVLTFRALNNSNQGIANVRVRFAILAPGLGGGERLSTSDSIVYTNASGFVTTDYIAGVRSSPTDGVSVRACYGLTDAQVNECNLFVITRLTVTGQALNLSIVENNELEKRFNNLIYVQKLAIVVVDSAGNPVRDAVISASVDITHYGKGFRYNAPYIQPGGIPTIADNYSTTLSQNTSPVSGTRTVINGVTVDTGFNVWCINEDLNRNGTRDVGDDLDQDTVLEPRASEITITTPGGNRTDADGRLLVEVSWGQTVANWLAYTVKATTNVGGSEGTNSKPFITNSVLGDEVNGAFLTPPYGVRNCRTNN